MADPSSSNQGSPNLLLQADWDDTALIAAFQRHYDQYNDYHKHGASGRPKKVARTQSNLHVHNPRPKSVPGSEPEPVEHLGEDDPTESEAVATGVKALNQEERISGSEEEEGAISDDEEPDLDSVVLDQKNATMIGELGPVSREESAVLHENKQAMIGSRSGPGSPVALDPTGHQQEQQEQEQQEQQQEQQPRPPATTSPSTVATPPLPGDDPDLHNLLLAWYYAGYYAHAHQSRLKAGQATAPFHHSS